MNFQENLLLAMAGSAIVTVGVLSLCVHFASALFRERILFGLVSLPVPMASHLFAAAFLCLSGMAWQRY